MVQASLTVREEFFPFFRDLTYPDNLLRQGIDEADRQTIEGFPQATRILFYCCSVGECRMVLPLIQQLQAMGYHCIILSKWKDDLRFLAEICPEVPVLLQGYDERNLQRKFLNVVRPRCILIAEAISGPVLNFAETANRMKIPLILLNVAAEYREWHHRTHPWLKPYFSTYFRCFDKLFVQSESEQDELELLGVGEEKIQVWPNLKFAPAENNGDNDRMQELSIIFDEFSKVPVILFANLCADEITASLALILELKKTELPCKFMIAPRYLKDVAQIVLVFQRAGIETCQRSHCDAPQTIPSQCELVVIDTMGELSFLYRFAGVAILGGSFLSGKGHNPLEALHAGVPVIFGPNMERSGWVVAEVLELQAGFQIQTIAEAQPLVQALLTSSETYARVVAQGKALLNRYQALIPDTIAALQPYL